MPGGEAALAIAGHRVRRQRDDRHVAAGAPLARADRRGGLEPAHVGHLQVHQDDVELLPRPPVATASRPLPTVRRPRARAAPAARRPASGSSRCPPRRERAASASEARCDARARRPRGRSGVASGANASTIASSRSDCLTGLVSCAAIVVPARVAAAGAPAEVSTISITPAIRGSALIARASVKPSMSGISASVITRSNGLPRHRPPRAARRARPPRSSTADALHLPAREHLLEDLPVGGVVVDDEHAQVRRALSARATPPRSAAAAARTRAMKWNVAALARLALDPDPSAHQLDQLRGDRQAQAGAAEAPRGRRVGLRERAEDLPLLVARDADAGVGDREAQRRLRRRHAARCATSHDDFAARR